LFQSSCGGFTVNVAGQCATQATIWREYKECYIAHWSLLQESNFIAPILDFGICEVRDEVTQVLGIGARLLNSLLCPAHPAACYHLHCLGDLGYILG